MELFLFSVLYTFKNGVILLSFGLLIAFYTVSQSQERCGVGTESQERHNSEVKVDLLDFEEFNRTLDRLLDSLPFFRQKVKCDDIIDEKASWKTVYNAQQWRFNNRHYGISFFSGQNAMCYAIKTHFGFYDRPLSQEEHDFPLAYGFLVHANPIQVLFLLSSVYQPQNQFCIAIDGKASERFKSYMFALSECFPNIFVMATGTVDWCDHSVLQGVYGCVQYLSRLKAEWKYFQVGESILPIALTGQQYLSGVDLPLKTNLEMVRIFKKLNGSFNAGIYDVPKYRYKANVDPSVPLWKSSLSAAFSRESAEFLVANEKVKEVYSYLKGTLCPDESFWATVAGNPDHIPMPGGFNASLWRQKLTGSWIVPNRTTVTPETTTKHRQRREARDFGLFKPEKYYIARYQVWYDRLNAKVTNICHGTFTSDSCVFGVKDLSTLARRPELVVHKLYFSIQPAAYFCLYEHMRRRALQANEDFNVDAYGELPGPRLMAGTPFEDVQFKTANGYVYY